jgi:hypothetical protein
MSIIYIKMDIDHICIALQKSNNKFEDQIEFFENNYNKVFMTVGWVYGWAEEWVDRWAEGWI